MAKVMATATAEKEIEKPLIRNITFDS